MVVDLPDFMVDLMVDLMEIEPKKIRKNDEFTKGNDGDMENMMQQIDAKN